MRITSSMYYNNLYGKNNNQLQNDLFDVNKQISSGLKIQYASDDISTFTQTMKLDNEVTTLGQVKKSVDSGYKMANQSDVTLNEFETDMDRMRTLLVQAANDTNDDTSRDAIADELRGIEKNLKGLANSSINGQYLFSGSAVSVKPIDDDGVYQGNADSINSFTGSNTKQAYNISGEKLFLGEEVNVKREITTNVVNTNVIDNSALTTSSSIRDMMGDKDDDDTTSNDDYFYIRGTKSDGTTFKDKIKFVDTDSTVGDLLDRIEKDFGTGTVDVSMNESGQIVVQDKIKGSSKLDFHMVGAVDYSGGNLANVDDIDDLNNGETTYKPNGDLYVKELIKSGFTSAKGAADKIEGLIYDRTEFSKEGAKLTSNVPQILKKSHIVQDKYGNDINTISESEKNSFAKPSTLISEVADLSQGNAGTLDGTVFDLTGKDINGQDYTVKVNFKSVDSNGDNGSYFSVDTDGDGAVDTDYNIYNMEDPRKAVDADKMTYQQLMNVVNMNATDKLPASKTADDYDTAITESKNLATTKLTYDGKISFTDLGSPMTQATISLYDDNADDFTKPSSVMRFNANDSLTVTDPKTDFFKTIDEIITSVEDHKNYPDSSSGHMRNAGIENSIAKMDDLQDHIFRSHATVGAQANTLSTSKERTELLEISTKTLRSSVIDTDLAEASLKLTQLNLNYQAMLSTVGKVSKLSLVNYL